MNKTLEGELRFTAFTPRIQPVKQTLPCKMVRLPLQTMWVCIRVWNSALYFVLWQWKSSLSGKTKVAMASLPKWILMQNLSFT